MKRSRIPSRPRASRDTERLAALASGLSLSGSRVEDRFWETRLNAELHRLLQAEQDEALNSTLDRLSREEGRAYDELADSVEACVESDTVETDQGPQDFLFFAAPLLAWSRYRIPAVSLPTDALNNLAVQLQAHVLAKDVKLALCDRLLSPDQLPRGYSAAYELARKLAANALKGRHLQVSDDDLDQTAEMFADARFIIGAVVVPHGAPIFRWQEDDGDRNAAREQWNKQATEVLRPLLTGCAFEMLLPDAYHVSCREADRGARPYSLLASVALLQATLGVAPEAIRAVIGPCYGRQLEEYRIGLTLADRDQVVLGVVWPLLGNEDEHSDVVANIEEVLNAAGVTRVETLDHRLPLEYCDDCGSPLYPNPDGDMVHAETPEHDESQPGALH